MVREKYWKMYTALKHKECYFKVLQSNARCYNMLVTVICLIASASSIAAWAIWSKYPLVWGGFIGAAQIIQVLQPVYPFTKQMTALKFLSPCLSKLLIEIDYDWDRVNRGLSDEETSVLVKNYYAKYQELLDQFIGDTYIPESKRYEERARINCQTYFGHRYGI